MAPDRSIQSSAWLARADPRYPGVWETLFPYLFKALEHDPGHDWDEESLRDGVLAGWLQLYALVNDQGVFGAGVSVDTVYPRRKVLTILAMGAGAGHEEEWQQCFEQFCAMAKAAGYSAVSATGREGWIRKLKVSRIRTTWEIDL